MIKILALSGSLRSNSFNTALLHAAQACAPTGCVFEYASIKDIPLYNQDDEDTTGIPPAVTKLKEKIKAADALLMSTPEYNNSIPGVVKNAIDWLTRPPAETAALFHHRKVGLIGASAGRFGTVLGQTAWLPILRYLNVHSYFGKQIFIASAHTAFNQKGELIDPTAKTMLQDYMQGFVQFVHNASLAT